MTDATRTGAEPRRLYYLDWLRVLIIGGVFLAHVVLPFTGGDWLIVSGSILPIAGVIAIVGNQFGMPLLFMISGAGVVFAMRKRTNSQFMRERFFRLIVPYLVLVLALSPIQSYYAALDHGTTGGSFLAYLPSFFNLNGFTGFNLQWAGYYGYHLWFLVFLFFYSVVAVPLFAYVRSSKGSRWIDRLARLCRPRGMILLLGLPIALSQIILRIPFPGYQDWADTFFWGFFFVYGYLCYSDPRLLEAIRRNVGWAIAAIVVTILAFVAIAFTTFISREQVADLTQTGLFVSTPALYVSILTLICLNSWAFMILFLALGRRFLDFTNRRLDYLGEASMPFYLLHHPVIVIIAFYVTHIAISPWAQLVTIGISAFLITAGLYHLFLRHINPARTAIGLRRLVPEARAAMSKRIGLKRMGYLAGVVAFALAVAVALPLIGMTTPSVVAASLPAGWIAFEPGGNTTCGNGSPYQFFTRQGVNADHLLIYFQAGGACWDNRTCDYESMAYDKSVNYAEMETYRGIFDFANPENPVAGYDMVFIPYCTADVHTGSRDHVYSDPLGITQELRHQGYVNAVAVLDWVYANYPDPGQIVVTGSSAGSVGSIFFAYPIMTHYPGASVVQLGDGYVGIMPSDWPGLEVWGTRANLPDALQQDMASATPDVFTTRLYDVSASALPQRLFAQFTTAADAFQIGYYAVAGGDPRQWADLMNESLNELNAIGNFRSYVADGAFHTILPRERFYTMQVNGVRLRDWFADLIGGEPVENVQCARGTSTCP